MGAGLGVVTGAMADDVVLLVVGNGLLRAAGGTLGFQSDHVERGLDLRIAGRALEAGETFFSVHVEKSFL